MKAKLLKTMVISIITTSFALVISSDSKAVVNDVLEKDKTNTRKTYVFPEDQDKPQLPKYAPGKILVGLKEDANIGDILQSISITPKSFKRIHDIKSTVNKFKKEGHRVGVWVI